MNLQRLLSSPPPKVGFSVEPEIAAVFVKDGKQQVDCALAPLAKGCIEVGPVGLQAVDPVRLAEALTPLGRLCNGTARVAVVIPSRWVRSQMLSFDTLPRKLAEVQEVVRWKLKKLVSVPPAQLRMSLVPQPSEDDSKKLLCTLGIERAFADLEAAFSRLNLTPGAIAPRAFALCCHHSAAGGFHLVIQQEQEYLTQVLRFDNSIRLVRSKPLPSPDGPWSVVAHEQHLLLSFIRRELEIDEQITVVVSAQAPELDHGLRAWWAKQGNVELQSPIEPLQVRQPTVAQQLGAARIEPVCGLLGGRTW